MNGQFFGPFRIEILGGMDIDGEPRTGVFLSAEIPQLRGVGAMMGDDVVIVRANLPPTLEQAKALPEIKALVEALRNIDALDPEGMIGGCSPDAIRGLVLRMGDMARAALRAIGEGGE